MKPRRKDLIAGILFALLIVHAIKGGGVSIVAPQATAAVYVYEQRSGSVPPAVLAGIDQLNKRNILATTFDVDTIDGTGQVPDQYVVPLAAAKELGLPALVVLAGNAVVRSVKAPTTEADVLGAVP